MTLLFTLISFAAASFSGVALCKMKYGRLYVTLQSISVSWLIASSILVSVAIAETFY